MLKEAVSSLGRWVGLAQSTESTEIKEDERRVWIRYPSSAEATCQPAAPTDSEPVVARVLDISRGGIKLVVNRWFDSGMLLSVQLPGTPQEAGSTVLAYVVRSTSVKDGEWILGCTFASELEEADLRPLGLERVRPDAPDQRSWERLPSDIVATYQVVKADSPNPRSARVLDVSPMGVGLLAEEVLEVGTVLNLELRSPDGKKKLIMLASVVRMASRAGHGSLLGCNFIRELTHRELKSLL
jgi:hypothetical protein